MLLLTILKIIQEPIIYYDSFLDNYTSLHLKESKEIYNNNIFDRLQIIENSFDDISKDKYNIEMKKSMRNIIKEGYKVNNNKDIINIDKKTINEYSFSKYSKRIDSKTRKIKLILTKYIKDLINNSTFYERVDNYKEKHNHDAMYGFDKYSIKFSIIDKNYEEIYTATILIRNSENKNKYLYDIINIKKIN